VSDATGRVAVEFGATSVTSPSESTYFEPFGIDFAGGVRARNPHVKFVDSINHGFLLLTLTRDQAMAEFFGVSTILSKDYETTRVGAFSVTPQNGPGIGAITNEASD
jgi:phosphodiesterase/alkaline phosphatase D-like protein